MVSSLAIDLSALILISIVKLLAASVWSSQFRCWASQQLDAKFTIQNANLLSFFILFQIGCSHPFGSFQ